MLFLPTGMPRFIFQVPETQVSECIHFLSQYEEVESFHQLTTFLMVKLAQNDSRTEAFLKELALFFPHSFRELCQAKCRDDTDCLNTALKGKYCWIHKELPSPDKSI